MREWILPALVSFGTGILSAWGVGGGTLLLLAMTLLLGVEQKTAQGINLLYFLPAAGAGVLLHRKNGHLRRQVIRSAVPASVLSALAAALIATGADTAALRRPFGVFLLLSALSLLRRKKQKKGSA